MQKTMCWVLCWAVGLGLLRLAYVASGVVGLSPDEAQYWHWLMQPEMSYVTKPPLTTWLMGVSTHIFGDTYLGVRFFAVVGHGIASILAFLIARKVKNRVAGWWAFGAFQVTPLLAIGGILMVTDVPALVFWLAGVYMMVSMNWLRPEWRKWIMLGVCVGLAGLSKYTAALFYPLLGLYLLWQRPAFLIKPQVWVAGMISLAFQAPVLWWNYAHEWVGILHVLGQADGGSSAYDMWQGLGDFLAGQAGVLGVISFLGMMAFWLNPRGCNDKQKILWAFAAPLFAFFVWQALGGKVQANWPILATSVSLIAVCTCLGTHSKVLVRGVFGMGLLMSAGLSFLLHDTFMLRAMGVELAMKNDPSKDLRGWGELAAEVVGEVAARDVSERPYVLTTRYRVMAEMAFELQRLGRGDIDVIYVNNGGHRMSQYDLWAWPDLEGRTAVVVRGGAGLPRVVRDGFTGCGEGREIKVKDRGLTVRTGVVTVCTGYVGMEKIMPTTH